MSQHGCPERLSNRSKGFQEEGAQPTMEVLVETLTGTAFEMTVSPSDTIFAIKSKICRVEGIPVSQQHLVYNLRELEDELSLRAQGIGDGARLRLVLGMRGGPVSTRRLPPPPEPWRDIERLLDSNREDSDWGCGSGCKVTVMVYREGERVNMLRVRHNPDGSYSPLHNHCESPPSPASPAPLERVPSGGSLTQNAVTMGKMLELRRRMETLNIHRHKNPGAEPSLHKTRSEESLSVGSVVPPPSVLQQYGYSELCQRCDCRCPTQGADRLKLSGGMSGGLVVSRRDARRPRSPDLASLSHDYGPLLGPGWARSASSLHSPPAPAPAPGPRLPALALSSPSLERAPAPAPPPLSRHRPREALNVPPPPPEPRVLKVESPPPAPPRKKPRCRFCRKRLSIATLHRCRCGAEFCAPHRYAEVHGCAYDYKATPTTVVVAAPKLPKI